MDADITQNYPEIWQLFLGGVMVLILFGLPGGVVGFIQQRDVGSDDDDATRTAKLLRQFRRKSWMFFGGALLFATFFAILHAPGAWLFPRARVVTLIKGGVASQVSLPVLDGTPADAIGNTREANDPFDNK